MTHATIVWAIAVGLALWSGYLWFTYAQEHYLVRIDYKSRSKLHHDLSLFSECGFYYSFYEQVTGANDTASAWTALLQDRLSEHPDTINAMARFNIYPEVIVGFLYRTVKHVPWLTPLLADSVLASPSAFYYFCVFAWNGLSAASIFMTGFVLSGHSLPGGMLAALAYAVNYKFSTQVQWSPTLREVWALPLAHLLMFQIVHWLSLADSQVRPHHTTAIGVVLVLALVPWQFTPFMLLAQVLSIYSVSLVGLVSLQRVAALFRVYAVAYAVAAVLMFGQLTFLHSFSFCFVVGVVALEYAERRGLAKGLVAARRSATLRWLGDVVVFRAFGAVAAFLAVFVTTKILLDTHANSHVSTFMSLKLSGLMPRLSELATGTDHFSGGSPPSFAHIHDFDTLMYVCQTEFDFMPIWAALRMFRASLLAQLSLAAILLVLTHLVLLGWRTWRKNADAGDAALFGVECDLASLRRRRAAELFMVAQSVSFLIYAVMVERFTVLSTPAFATLIAVLASAELPFALIGSVRRRLQWPAPSAQTVAESRMAHQALAVLLVLGVAWHNKGLLDALTKPSPVPLDHNAEHSVELMRFIYRSTPANASFAASMPLVSSIRFITGRAIAMHPQYESADTRARIRKVYQMYGLMALADAHRLLRDDVRVDYFVLEHDYCNGQLTNGCFVVDMVDENRHHGKWRADQIACKKALSLPASNAMFERVFQNQKYVVLKVK
jgi:hypothetical protein